MMTRHKYVLAWAMAFGLWGCVDTSAPVFPLLDPSPAFVQDAARQAQMRREASIVPGSFNVLFKRRVSDPQAGIQRLASRSQGRVGSRWVEGQLRGFSLHNISHKEYLAIAQDPDVLVIEPVRRWRPLSVQDLPAGGSAADSLYYLDRIDHYGAASDSYDYGSTGNTGAGVHIYIIDGGIRGGHQEFTGRLGNGFCTISKYWGNWLLYHSTACDPYKEQSDWDGEAPDGHGTGMAAIAAGDSLGVAKNATIHSVRVNDDQGSIYCNDVAAGLNWIRTHAILPAVVNVSLGPEGGDCVSVAFAFQNLIQIGIPVVRAAGNVDGNAGDWYSNTVTGLIVVGATNKFDARWNPPDERGCAWGGLVQIAAPGEGFRVASMLGNSAYSTQTYSGTSNSAALVSGTLARFLELKPAMPLTEIMTGLFTQASPVTIAGGNGMANRILYSGITVAPNGTTPTLPSVANLSVQIEGYSTVRPGDGCYFYGHAEGGSGDYHYAWRVGPYDEGDDSEYLFYQNAGSSFTVSVSVSDGSSIAEATFEVTVSSEAGECYIY